MSTSKEALSNLLNKVAKWRIVFASWQLGTRPDSDPECAAVKDHREGTLLARMDINALTGLLIKKGVITQEEFAEALMDEAKLMDADLERRFPGFSTTNFGVHISIEEAAKTMKGWKP